MALPNNAPIVTPPTVNDITNQRNAAAGAPLAVYGGADKGMGLLPPTSSNSTTTSSTPVITSSNAKDDLASKQAAFSNMQAQNALQAAKISQQNALAANDKAEADKQAQEQKNIQAGIDQKNAEIAAKNAALGVGQPSPNTNAPTTPVGAENGTSTPATTAPGTTSTPPPASSPISSLNQQNAPIQNGINDATSNYLGASQDIQAQKDQVSSQMSNQLTSLLNGTFPLSGPQQAQITSIQSKLAQNEASQQVANQAYVGQVTEQAIRAGSEYVNGQMQGMVANAISYGTAKVQALDDAATSTISTLEQSFQKDNYDLLNKNYDILTKQLDDKANALKDTYDTVTKQLATQQAYNMDLAKFAQTQDQNAFDNAFKTEQQIFAEKQGAFDDKIKSATLGLEQAKFAATQTGGANTGINTPVNMTGNNTPSKLDQQAFLGQVATKYGPMTATLVQGIANYTINPNTISARSTSGLNRALIVSLAAQYDPTFSQSDFATRQAVQTSFTSGKYSQNINSLNTAVGHLTDILSNTKGLNNGNIPFLNSITNNVKTSLGAGATAKAGLNISAATSELASVFKGSGATDDEIKALGKIDVNSSPDQIKQYVESATQLMGSRLQALNDTYTAGMGKGPSTPFLSSSSQTALLGLQKQGLNIQVPELQNTPIVRIQQFHDASPDNAKTYDALVAQFPNASPEQIQEALNLQ